MDTLHMHMQCACACTCPASSYSHGPYYLAGSPPSRERTGKPRAPPTTRPRWRCWDSRKPARSERLGGGLASESLGFPDAVLALDAPCRSCRGLGRRSLTFQKVKAREAHSSLSRVPGRTSETLELLAFEVNSELRTFHGCREHVRAAKHRQPWGKHDSHVVAAESGGQLSRSLVVIYYPSRPGPVTLKHPEAGPRRSSHRWYNLAPLRKDVYSNKAITTRTHAPRPRHALLCDGRPDHFQVRSSPATVWLRPRGRPEEGEQHRQPEQPQWRLGQHQCAVADALLPGSGRDSP
eukprot:scaffold55114_cov56-Phaeocystis_antarctica.AAC.4